MADELQEVAEVEGETPTEETADAENLPQENEGEESESETQETEDTSKEIKSERGQKRVQDLANKAKEAKELEKKNGELEAKLAELEPLVAKKPQEVDPLRAIEDFAPKLTGDYESDIRTVEERATKKAVEALQIEQAKRDALLKDVYACEDAYPELRKGSEEYDEKLSNEVVQFYNELKSVNPDIRLKPVVDRIMRVKGYAAQKSETRVSETLRQQANESAVTPSNNLAQKPEPKDMSLAEIEKMVGTVSSY